MRLEVMTQKPLWSAGFRPFFLGAGIYSLVLMTFWMLHQLGVIPFWLPRSASSWHGHEMIYGFATSAVSGFLLTATAKWTGIKAIQKGPLFFIFFIWFAARVVAWCSGDMSLLLFSILDLSFIPLLLWLLWPYLALPAQKKNRIFIWMLLLLALGNILTHCGFWIENPKLVRGGLHTGLQALMIFVVVIGGRVIPFFTSRSIKDSACKSFPLLERLAFWSIVGLGVAGSLNPRGIWAGIFAIIAGTSNLLRWGLWRPDQSFTVPLLWALFTGYFWLCVGLILLGLSVFVPILPALSIHAVTIGGVGITVYAMMTRVSLGHTGRPMIPRRGIVISYGCLNLAVMFRVLWPVIAPENYFYSVQFSGWLWILAYIVFIIYYYQILVSPRLASNPN